MYESAVISTLLATAVDSVRLVILGLAVAEQDSVVLDPMMTGVSLDDTLPTVNEGKSEKERKREHVRWIHEDGTYRGHEIKLSNCFNTSNAFHKRCCS